MRKFLVLSIIAVSVIAGAALAQATVYSGTIDTVTCTTDCSSMDVTAFSGTITCTVGNVFDLRLQIRQNQTLIADGRSTGVCTGSSQPWTSSDTRNYLPLNIATCYTVVGIAREPAGDRTNLAGLSFNC